MQSNRRKFLLTASGVLGTTALVGYKDTIGAVASFKTAGQKTQDPIYGNSLSPEFSLNGDLSFNSDFSIFPSICNGCVTHCGIRVKVDNKTNSVVRAVGNPYNPLSSDPWLSYDTPLKESFEAVGQKMQFRSTMCARGNSVFDKESDEFRVLKPLKRVGKRGSNKWQEIEIETLIQEIVNGGDLFGEGNVEGLKSIRNIVDPIDANDPAKGPKANGLCIIGTGNDGRKDFLQERFQKSFGTKNYQGHTAICGLSMRAGEAAYLSDFQKYPHLKPDFENTSYLLTFGTAPGQAGNPFKRQANLVANARVDKNAKIVCVSPMLTNVDNISTGKANEWVPIIPGEDLALVIGLLQIIINQELYNKDYLSLPSKDAMKKAKDLSFTNASHLILPNGKFAKNGDDFLCLDLNGEIKPAKMVEKAMLEVEGEFLLGGEKTKLESSFSKLKKSVNALSLDELSSKCGVSVAKMQEIAKEFCANGRTASIDCHGGTMHSTGFYTTYAIMMLGAMVGNLNYKGGMSKGGGKYKDTNGKIYNLAAYKGKVKPQGYRIDKTRVKYEKTKEFKAKIDAGQNPYPAFDTFYPLTNALETEILNSSAQGYPYKLKAIMSWNANFMYGQSGAHHFKDLLQDPSKATPLFIAIDPFINETSMYADYIVPDSIIYDTWGSCPAWAATQTKMNILGFPIKEQKQAKFKNGESVSMDSFLIELGKALNLPGFGKNAIKAQDGSLHDLDIAADFYLRAYENIALDETPVPDITDDELKMANLESYKPLLQKICKDNWRKTAYVMARGGRYEAKEDGYKGKALAHPFGGMISVYNEALASTKHSLTGKNFSGCVRYFPAQINDGTSLESLYPKAQYPLSCFSYKSNVLSQCDASSDELSRVRYTTYLDLNPKTAKDFGLKHGDLALVTSGGGEVKGMVRLRNGVLPNSIGIEHGLGRDAEGAVSISINGKTKQGKIRRKSGVNINKLGLKDSSRSLACLADFVIGSNVRQAIPAKIAKI